MEIVKITEDAILPKRQTPGSVGYDVHSIDDYIIPCQCGCVIINTGIVINKIPPGVYIRLAERSSLAAKCIYLGGGVIDVDYQGEIKVCLYNHGLEDFVVNKGDRIAQLIPTRYESPEVIQVPSIVSTTTDRGVKGFGSTGI